jgi:predicted glycosyltransferase
MPGPRPSVLFYCQHSLGMGHLVRSLALAAGLSAKFRVVLLSGGALPNGLRIPSEIKVIDLPPLGFDENMQLVSRDERTVEDAKEYRRQIILDTFDGLRPEVVLIELFPFGRKKFAAELLPLLEKARACADRPMIVCSLRDILVGQRRDQQAHEERAAEQVNRYFDAILVHSDPTFARFEESFHAKTPLEVPIYHTGFVSPDAKPFVLQSRARRIVVSAGGGLVGEPLLRTAIEAHALLSQSEGVELKVIAGPFFPEPAWESLRCLARGRQRVELCRFVPDLVSELRAAAGSISQCGYNTVLDLVRSEVPALVVPYAQGKEDEQMKRARRLEAMEALRVLDQSQLSAERLAEEMRQLLRFTPRPVSLELTGCERTGAILQNLLDRREAALATSRETVGVSL